MKKFLLIFIAFVAVVTTGCLKDVQSTNLYATGNPIVEFEYPAGGNNTAIGSGLEYFAGGALTYPSTDASDTALIIVNIASTNTLSQNLSITIGPVFKDNQDNFANDGIVYTNMPDSDYSILNATQTIPAGHRQDTFLIVFYPDKIDPTQNFALPITATSSGSIPVSGDFGHVYFHTIGNLLAGSYNQEWIRWNNNTGTGMPTYDELLGSNTFAPVNNTSVSVTSGTGITYVLSFTNGNTNGGNDLSLLTNFQLSITPASVAAAGITITAPGPSILKADPVNHVFWFTFPYNNSAGSARVIEDKFSQ